MSIPAIFPFLLPSEELPRKDARSSGKTNYQAYQASLVPSWLQKPIGQAWLQAFGYIKDVLADRLKQGLKSRMPLLAPTDALNSLGFERQIDRGTNETDASYAARVQGAWDSWPTAGTAFGLLKQLLAAGYTPGGNAVWVEQAIGPESTLDVNGAYANPNLAYGWTFDPGYVPPSVASLSFWSKFLVLVTVFPVAWAGVPPGNSSDDANRFRRIITAWKAAHATCTGIAILQSGYLFDYPRRTFAQMTGTFASYAGTATQWTYP